MKDSDSYPPSETGNNLIQVDNLAKDVFESSENSEETSSESDDVRLSSSESGEDENQIVADDEFEEYEEESTGIKISYKLSPEEVYGVVRRIGNLKDTVKTQQRQTLLHAGILGVIIAIVLLMKNPYYFWFALLPVLAIISIWCVPFFGVRKILSKAFNNKPITLEVFPDEIDIIQGDAERKIILDDSYESEEYDDIIVIMKDDVIKLMLPLRAVEPEFRAEVQAIILAGIKPKEED
ncbi:MAG: hypothetical protein IKE41_00520 [Clostridia bacterium]|nr:hypothetical protein [Clostridia bacterium]MBR2734749.1 hypothetical protein [Clostridia bacterium]